jgi:hypothetical protein
MRLHAKFSPILRVALSLCVPLLFNLAQAQTPAGRSLADEMDSTNTATGRMLELVKAAKAQEQAAKGLGPSAPLPAIKTVTTPANAPSAGNAKNKPAAKTKPADKEQAEKEQAETPTLWFLAGIGERLIAELVYQQRVYKLSASSVAQSVGPWKLLSISPQGLRLSLHNGQVLELLAPERGQAPPQFAAAPVLTSPPAVPAIVPSFAPGTSTQPNIFPLPK